MASIQSSSCLSLILQHIIHAINFFFLSFGYPNWQNLHHIRQNFRSVPEISNQFPVFCLAFMVFGLFWTPEVVPLDLKSHHHRIPQILVKSAPALTLSRLLSSSSLLDSNDNGGIAPKRWKRSSLFSEISLKHKESNQKQQLQGSSTLDQGSALSEIRNEEFERNRSSSPVEFQRLTFLQDKEIPQGLSFGHVRRTKIAVEQEKKNQKQSIVICVFGSQTCEYRRQNLWVVAQSSKAE